MKFINYVKHRDLQKIANAPAMEVVQRVKPTQSGCDYTAPNLDV